MVLGAGCCRPTTLHPSLFSSFPLPFPFLQGKRCWSSALIDPLVRGVVGMGLLFVQRLDGEGVFKCRRCRVDAASKDAIISRDFYGRSGRAYLFDHVFRFHRSNAMIICKKPANIGQCCCAHHEFWSACRDEHFLTS
ncbi:hypothetical protein GUJ93_ZPchr0006g40938 [Zizania palustris]|uniref:Yippee domain-containing protein n=1 Tax=Zizania palustris TaxID=103762 RepID=A0A8J5SF40_ZIZPA|nr:hypothetical protein GUJ93_ZPchr0006g40938 [Zizania palustris]KAG8073836.1 hypothetical protein GUJ93_ZPchr0006g40938 [Zizania palustris]